MTKRRKEVVLNIIEDALQELTDSEFQHRVWLGNGVNEIASLNEAIAGLYDDSGLDIALERNDITFSKDIDNDLKTLLRRLMSCQRMEVTAGTQKLLDSKEWVDVQSLASSILLRIRGDKSD